MYMKGSYSFDMVQGFQGNWKTLKGWKYDSNISSHRNIMEFENL